jgi:hypothetical protein
MGDWEPDEDVEPDNGYTRGYLWIVPAQVSGTWTLRQESGEDELQMRIEQEFQNIDVSLPGQSGFTVQAASLRGADIEVTLRDNQQQTVTLKGRVDDGTMRLAGRGGGKTVTYVGRRS